MKQEGAAPPRFAAATDGSRPRIETDGKEEDNLLHREMENLLDIPG
ncbi:MAG: hypothetical protein HY282_02355 [Nitrospirae bacterium]|nr:hypothetical protein [Candidatus Manganitrophaceae bacterium]